MCVLLVVNSLMLVIILIMFIVNLWNFLLSVVFVFYFLKYLLVKNVGIGMMVIDELFGVVLNKIVKNELINDCWMFGLNFIVYVCWVLLCVVGVVFGKWIINLELFGLDFVVMVMFLVLLVF